MWWRRKPKNRRLGQARVLEVRAHSSRLRALRLRAGALSLATVLGVTFGGYVGYRTVDWAWTRWVKENRALAIRHIEVQTDGVIAPEQIRRWSGIKPGENLVALDLAAVRRNLELVSSIATVELERQLPNTVRIRVTEREPLALVHVPRLQPDGTPEMTRLYVDAQGWVFEPVPPHHRVHPPGPEEEALPVLLGQDPLSVQPGRRLESPPVRAALDFILAFERSALAGRVELRTVQLTGRDVLLVTTGQGSQITLGLHDLERQLRRWREICELGWQRGLGIATLDLSVTNNIPARWIEAGAPPPAPTPRARPERSKRRHV